MSVEQGTTIADLVVTNPLVEDKVHEGPNHFWLIKKVLKNVFPGAGGQGFAKPITANEDDFNCIAGCSTTDPDGANWRLKNFVINIKTALASINDRLTAIETGGVGQAAWPVGSIFISYSDQNPAVLLGFGTWSRTANGRVIVGVDSGNPDFGVTGKTGGNKDVRINGDTVVDQTENAGLHAHTYSSGTGSASTTQAGTHKHSYSIWQPSLEYDTDIISNPHPRYHKVLGGALQPYITAYIWKRDA